MSKYREPSEKHDVTFDELEILEKLLKRKSWQRNKEKF